MKGVSKLVIRNEEPLEGIVRRAIIKNIGKMPLNLRNSLNNYIRKINSYPDNYSDECGPEYVDDEGPDPYYADDK